jgi:hypothetical protein
MVDFTGNIVSGDSSLKGRIVGILCNFCVAEWQHLPL